MKLGEKFSAEPCILVLNRIEVVGWHFFAVFSVGWLGYFA